MRLTWGLPKYGLTEVILNFFFVIVLHIGQTFFNLAFVRYLHLQFFNHHRFRADGILIPVLRQALSVSGKHSAGSNIYATFKLLRLRPLFVLLGAFVISLLITKLFTKSFDYPLSGRISMAALIIFFILLLPGNIKAAIYHVDYLKGTFDGSGLNYLWFRIPLQMIFIVWTYICVIRF